MSLQWGASSAVEARPSLAILVAEIVAVAADIDAQLGDTFTAMLGADAKPALAMYNALRAPNIQSDVMMAAAKEVLDERSLFGLEAVLAFATSSMADRHKFAHWHWGISHAHPDVLLLMKPDGRRSIDRTIKEMTVRAGGSGRLDPPADLSTVHDAIGNALAYCELDLRRVLERMGAVRRAVARMHKLVDAVRVSSPSVDEIWQELVGEPELAEAVARRQTRQA